MRHRNKQRRGASIIELAFIIFPLVLMLLGVTVVGLQLGQSIRAAQITRDAGSMYVRGIDFTLEGNKDILVRLAQGMGLEKTGGKGVLIFTKVTWVSQAECDASGLPGCNGDRHVIAQRVTVGNGSLKQSALGTPGTMDDKGNVLDFMTDASAIAHFPYMQLRQGETAFVTEGFFDTPEITMPGYHNQAGVYTTALY